LTAYYTLLRRSLTKTASISGFNLKIKFEFWARTKFSHLLKFQLTLILMALKIQM
jgi:hypothetical protein